jgi:hypothetical protein
MIRSSLDRLGSCLSASNSTAVCAQVDSDLEILSFNNHRVNFHEDVDGYALAIERCALCRGVIRRVTGRHSLISTQAVRLVNVVLLMTCDPS